jgi:hypothetical protein
MTDDFYYKGSTSAAAAIRTMAILQFVLVHFANHTCVLLFSLLFKGREKPYEQSQANTGKSGVRGRRKDVNTEQWDFFGGGGGSGGGVELPHGLINYKDTRTLTVIQTGV